MHSYPRWVISQSVRLVFVTFSHSGVQLYQCSSNT